MTDQSQKPKTRKWVTVLLVVSLGLNLMVVGAFLSFSKNAPRHTFRDTRAQDVFGQLGLALPPGMRRAFRRELSQHRKNWIEDYLSLPEIRDEILRALGTEPFDIEPIKVVLAPELAKYVSLGELVFETLMHAIEEMDADEREAYAEKLRNIRIRPARSQRPGSGG